MDVSNIKKWPISSDRCDNDHHSLIIIRGTQVEMSHNNTYEQLAHINWK